MGPGAIAQTFARAAAMKHLKPRVLSADPFIQVFNEFATADEAVEVSSLADTVGLCRHAARTLEPVLDQ